MCVVFDSSVANGPQTFHVNLTLFTGCLEETLVLRILLLAVKYSDVMIPVCKIAC